MKPVRKLYDWVLSLADKPWGPLALFLIAFAESSFFPIPPDVLLIALVLGSVTRAWKFAVICTLGSVAGGMFGYWIGQELWWAGTPPALGAEILRENFSALALFCFDNLKWVGLDMTKFLQIQVHYAENGALYVFVAGFSPIPYKLFTIASGAFQLEFWQFVGISAVSRGARFFLVTALLRKFGQPIKDKIEKHFNLATLAFVILLVLGFAAVKLLGGHG